MKTGQLPDLKIKIFLITGIAASFICLIIGSIYLMQKIRTVSKEKMRVEESRNNVSKLESFEGTFTSPTKAEMKAWKVTKKELWKFIPPTPRTNVLINDLSILAFKYNIRDISLKVEEEGASTPDMNHVLKFFPGENSDQSNPEKNIISATKLKLTFHSSFKNLSFFLNSFDTFNRIITINKLQINKEPSGLFMEMLITAYFKPDK